MTHPRQEELALAASGDLSWGRWLRLRLHTRGCGFCREELRSFAGLRASMEDSRQAMPAEADWDQMALEMKANIRLGLEAGQCVARVPSSQPLGPAEWWRPAVALGSLLVLVTAGWWYVRLRAMPRVEQVTIEAPAPVLLRATLAGIGVEHSGFALSVRYEGSRDVTVSAGGQGSLKARYVDEETGQVTITHVYTE